MDGLLYLGIYNETKIYPCYHAGQFIYVKKVISQYIECADGLFQIRCFPQTHTEFRGFWRLLCLN